MQRAVFRPASIALLALALAACHAKSKGTTSASTTGTSGTTGTTDADAGASAVVDDGACQARIAYDQRCADTDEMKSDACAADRKATCGKEVATYSAAYAAAARSCFVADTACGDSDACIADALSTTTPTAAMLKVRDDYCATCGDEAGPDCANAFFAISPDDGNGDGYLILQVSDDMAAAIDANCTGSALDIAAQGATNCREGFLYCAANAQENAVPAMPDSCYPPAPPTDDDAGDQGGDDAGAADAAG